MHRLVQVLGATTLVTLIAACGNNSNRHEEAATAPAGLSPSTAAAGSAGGGASATLRPGTPSTAVPTSAQPVKQNSDPAHLIIYPDHIGQLKIGMSLTAAKATGLIVVNPGQGNPGPASCISAHWKGQSDHGWMIFNGRYGLRALDSFGDQKTPEGIKPGSTLAAVRHAYPHLTWRLDGDETPDAQRTRGDALVDVAKGDGAHYRINIQKSKVADVQLESDRAGCYE